MVYHGLPDCCDLGRSHFLMPCVFHALQAQPQCRSDLVAARRAWLGGCCLPFFTLFRGTMGYPISIWAICFYPLGHIMSYIGPIGFEKIMGTLWGQYVEVIRWISQVLFCRCPGFPRFRPASPCEAELVIQTGGAMEDPETLQ